MSILARTAVSILACMFVVGAAVAGKGNEPVKSVRLAPSWESAIAEAKERNVPLVVHHHGFYCPPCWGMHANVMCNEKYIEFAEENTVEVIALQDLERAMAKENPDATEQRRLSEYDAKDEKGNKVRYMCEFPGLTRDQVLALHRSKASSYNDTKGIPFTVVIDPWTEKEMHRWAGGGHGAKSVMEGVAAQKKTLGAQRGPSVGRGAWLKIGAECDRVAAVLGKDGAAKAMSEFRKLEKSIPQGSTSLTAKIEPTRSAILAAAALDLDAAQSSLDSGDAAGAKKILDRYGPAFDGTDLASRIKELVAKLKG
ncbi:MAG: hypothetical protein HMLKMBBP_00122 [Planctomycetes bacterium]|nr:hypothetical protein [Planctomycetota bacterium]